MARTYRFFTRNVGTENLLYNMAPGKDFHFTENLEPDIFFQLTKVLRIKPGDTIILLPTIQEKPFMEFEYLVQDVQKKNIVLRFEKEVNNENELDFHLGLILCLPNKPDKLEFIVQKAVELGVKTIVLVEGDFSQFRHSLREERLQKVMIEATEQSERAVIPRLTIEKKLQDYLKNLPKMKQKNIWVALERADNHAEPSLQKLAVKNKEIHILIGPEGGFSKEERRLIQDLQLHTLSLGRRILRMETAAIVSLGLASYSTPVSII